MLSNLKIPKSLQIILIILTNVVISLSLEPPKLFKCFSELQHSSIEIPEALQPPFSENTTEYWKQVYGKNLFHFQFSPSWFDCPSKNTSVINLTLVNNYTLSAKPRNHQFILNQYYFTPEGTLKTTDGGIREWVNPKRYCISEFTNEHIQVQICKPSCGQDDICLNKCCGAGQILELDYNRVKQVGCQEVPTSEWSPPIYKEARGFGSHYEIVERTDPVHFTHKIVPCRPFEIISPGNHVKSSAQAIIRILESGKVMTRRTSNHPWRELSPDYCLDRIHNLGISESFDPSPKNIVIGLCDSPSEEDKTTSKVYFSTFIISSIFALLTVIVYVALWDKQNIHGWTVVGFSVSMFFCLVTTAFGHGVGLFQEHDLISSGSILCVLNGFSVTSTNLYIISSLSPMSGRSRSYNRLLGYSLFGFGVPTVVVSVAIAIDIAYKGDEDTFVYKPLYGYNLCSVDKSSFVYYTTVVNLILYTFNLIFAGLVAKTLYQFKQDTKRASSSCSKKSRSQ
ncbi:unnamed protein product [Allacma fusca]|uniref:Uncharacterized protein n=1 Tax=Allacma fusca TaxID=39272 RepID=A0A8J2JH21_9HEXA|nr:unnamed protein product [Allacma fusca]